MGVAPIDGWRPRWMGVAANGWLEQQMDQIDTQWIFFRPMDGSSPQWMGAAPSGWVWRPVDGCFSQWMGVAPSGWV